MRSTGIDPVYELKSYIEPPGTIVLEETDNIIERVITQKLDTTEDMVKARLIELGWIHKSMISDAARRELEKCNASTDATAPTYGGGV